MNDPETNRRFDRIENKIDRLTDLMANVARVEEKLVGVDGRLKRHEFRLDECEKKIDSIDGQVTTNTEVVKTGRAILGSVWAALIGAVVYLFRGEG